MHCSSLNPHLYSKNIVDSPLCQCGAIETTKHYLLYCPLYNVHRQLFIEPFFDDPLISYDHYLFGSPELGTYKVRNEIETKRHEINENETKSTKTKRKETKSTK